MTAEHLRAVPQLVRDLRAAHRRASKPADRLAAFRAMTEVLEALPRPSALRGAVKRARATLARMPAPPKEPA